MKTPATEIFPDIEWQQGELIDNHDGCREYAAYGKDADGIEYIATWWQTGDDNEIQNIEPA